MRYLTLFLGLIFTCPILAQPTTEIIENLSFRNIGPAFMTGRIADIAKDPTDPSTWYVATASSNVWKTRDNGTTWTPIFDQHGSYSTGCITVDPHNPMRLWLGTGENQSQRSVGWGDGIYLSQDGGKSWKNMGLKNSQHIAKIIVDPRDDQTIYVAAQGPLWRDGGDRGVYKSTDGGETWTRTLHVSEQTGVSEILQDAKKPDILYANTYQRRRHVGILVAGGPESRIYKSIDAGESWQKLEKGLPTGDVGRIAMAISPQDPQMIYAMIAATEDASGFYRSEDGGMNWKKVNDYTIVDPQYYGEIYADPHHSGRVYVMDVVIHVTDNHGNDFRRLNTRFKHVDNHALVFDHSDPDYLMIGCDGGIYETWNQGETWRYHDNLPIVQFYRVGLDDDQPFYHVYGGTQDNSTLMGPSQTLQRHGITNRDWTLVLGGDGFQARVDRQSPHIVYAQSQYAGLVRYDRNTGQRTELQPQPAIGGEAIRWHWDAPLIISHYDAQRLYFAAQHLYQSDDRGDTWKQISHDLTRGEDRNQREVMGKVWPPEAVWKNVFTSPYGTVVALSESPVQEGTLIAGTDDGLIQISHDHGNSWTKIDHLEGIPERAYVADVFASFHDAKVFYAVLNNHKEGDFNPYVVKTTDGGKSWRKIVQGISSSHTCWTIYEDFTEPNLLFLGTEFGLWCSLDAGESWTQMKGGLPTIAVRDLEIQQRENDLVLATFGRGFYILDDFQILRNIAQGGFKEGIQHISDHRQYFSRGDLGYAKKGVFGDNFFTADNPQAGTRIQIYLAEKILTKKDQRNSEEYPTYETLRDEDLAQDPSIFVLISNPDGKPLCSVPIENRNGFQEVFAPLRIKHSNQDGKIERPGPLLSPGQYHADLHVLRDGLVSKIGTPHSFNIHYLDLSQEKPTADYFDFYQVVTKALIRAEHLLSKIDNKLELTEHTINLGLISQDSLQIDQLHRDRLQLKDMQYQLRGDQTRIKRFQYAIPGVVSRLRRIYNNQFQSWQITNTHRQGLTIASQLLDGLEQDLSQMK